MFGKEPNLKMIVEDRILFEGTIKQLTQIAKEWKKFDVGLNNYATHHINQLPPQQTPAQQYYPQEPQQQSFPSQLPPHPDYGLEDEYAEVPELDSHPVVPRRMPPQSRPEPRRMPVVPSRPRPAPVAPAGRAPLNPPRAPLPSVPNRKTVVKLR